MFYGSHRELLDFVRLMEWCDGVSDDSLWEKWREGEWGSRAVSHVMERLWNVQEFQLNRCNQCNAIAPLDAKYCPQCGYYIFDTKQQIFNEIRDVAGNIIDTYTEGAGDDDEPPIDDILPSYGVYIYYHSIEGYKIGQAENVPRRMLKHECSAPSLELLHVIETSNLDWAERFIHGKFARRRRVSNHEYFDLTFRDLTWLFSVKVLNPPKTIDNQMSLLDLL